MRTLNSLPLPSILPILKGWFANVYTAVGGILSGLLTMFAPILIAIFATAAMIILDMIYGIRVSQKYNIKAIESHKLWKTGIKLIDAAIAIICAFIIDEFILVSVDAHAVEFIAGIISMIEFWSILESMCELYPKWAVWKILEKVIKAKGEKYLEVNLDDELPNNTKDNTNTTETNTKSI